MCNGVSPQCPTSEPKANFTACHGETQVCLNGVREQRHLPATWRNRSLEQQHCRLFSNLTLACPCAPRPHSPPTPQGCSGSICEKYGLEACTCASQDGKDETELCHVCCMEKSESSSAALLGLVIAIVMEDKIKQQPLTRNLVEIINLFRCRLYSRENFEVVVNTIQK